MFERLNTPQEAYNYKLGAALKMEQKVLDILDESIDKAHDERVRRLLSHHQEETRRQLSNIERAFSLMGWEVDDSPCPAIEGLEKEGKSTARKTDDALVDAMLLQSAVEVEHHEIGTYENLIIGARALGRDDVAELLGQNIEQERHTLEEVRELERQLMAATAGQRLH